MISEQGSALAYAVTERSETGKSNDLCSSRLVLILGVLQCSRVDMIQELRLKVQVPTGTGYILKIAKQILLVVVLGKPLILRVPVVVPLILVVSVVVIEHCQTR
jgi:hypothetical protein